MMRRCSVEDCDRTVLARGWCKTHYQRWTKHGDPQAHIPLPTKAEAACSVQSCERVARARGLCSLHDERRRRTGSPMANKPPMLKRTSCEVAGCERKHEANGLCNMHWLRMRDHGSLELPEPTVYYGSEHPAWKGSEVTYPPAHTRVVRARGSASLHICINCGGQAQDWAYDHDDFNELTCAKTGRLYSGDVEHYRPLCRPCHKRIDNAARRGDLACVLEVMTA